MNVVLKQSTDWDPTPRTYFGKSRTSFRGMANTPSCNLLVGLYFFFVVALTAAMIGSVGNELILMLSSHVVRDQRRVE